MTKKDLSKAVRNISNLPMRESVNIVESVLDILKETLATGEDVKIAGFGKFAIQGKNPRRGRNPLTGESLTIAARKIITFRPSPLLKQKVNND